MMRTLLVAVLTTLLACSGSLSALADDGTARPGGPSVAFPPAAERTASSTCPDAGSGPFDLAQLPTDCCKGHKGICGCRAGKIVCCDNTVSPNCSCHSDWGIEN